MRPRAAESTRGSVFPIAEIFGRPHDEISPLTFQEHHQKKCPFSEVRCEKFRQYKLSTCSAWYAAEGDDGVQKRYAICDHRLDGAPIQWAVSDYFKDRRAILVPEVTLATRPNKLNVDYFAFDSNNKRDVIAIEAQTIDTRGGSLRPAWDAWLSGDTYNWRSFYTKVANENERPDTFELGINTSNVRKRLAVQIAEKGGVLSRVGIPLYVIMQNSILERLRSVIGFHPVEEGKPWNITFVGFDFDGTVNEDGQLGLQLMTTTRTTYDNYTTALIQGGWQDIQRNDVHEKVLQKYRRQLRTRRGQELAGQMSLE